MRQMLALLLVSVMMSMAGCETATPTVGTECAVWLPITWSQQDTDETIREIKANNARRAAWCDNEKVVLPAK